MLDAQYLIKNGIDYNAAVERCVGNAGLYERILLRFAEELPGRVDELLAAYDARDYTAVHDIAHDLKGSGGNLSITGVYNSSIKLLEIVRAEEYDELEAAIGYFGAVCRDAAAVIKKAHSL